MPDANELMVEVAYATPEEQALVGLKMPAGSTAEEAIQASGFLQRFTDIDLASRPVGIFGKVCELTRVLQAGDRVEIYRPLLNDPKAARRLRAEKSR